MSLSLMGDTQKHTNNNNNKTLVHIASVTYVLVTDIVKISW
jgi:hypothetical protein